ncbi:helix-turn-helix domain-containing protein [Phenylobacterium sp.]|uniref:TetR/AcrR family transcriptional regulator n=1 Tax=Phenylobacterium sp. TaxID=1871053 RepID=UPI00286EB0A9|nr:helix-turn-helix domain-containing protein [Phenylobacterium sp.]
MAQSQRRQPRQARAVATQAAIFEATAQILEGQGEAALTTNAIAERAAISIGTLYQYHADKASILVAMALAENAKVRTQLMAAAGPDGVSPARLAIRAQIAIMADRPATRRACLKAILATEHIAAEEKTTNRLIERHPGDRLDRFVISRAVIGVIRAAVLEGSPVLADPGLEDALVKLTERYSV